MGNNENKSENKVSKKDTYTENAFKMNDLNDAIALLSMKSYDPTGEREVNSFGDTRREQNQIKELSFWEKFISSFNNN